MVYFGRPRARKRLFFEEEIMKIRRSDIHWADYCGTRDRSLICNVPEKRTVFEMIAGCILANAREIAFRKQALTK